MNIPREKGPWVKLVLAAFMIVLGAIGFVRADSVVGPVCDQTTGVSPTSDITEDPGPIITVWKRLHSRTPFAAATDLTEDPSPIGSFWKKLRADTHPRVVGATEDPGPISSTWKKLRPDSHQTVDVVTEDPTPTNTFWKKLRSPGLFPTDRTATISPDPIEVMYVFYFIESDPVPILLIAEPN